MASFADSPQTFLPEGAPLVDLNLYDQALSHKDQEYSQGVQRVQNAYDQVSGLDVIRGIDRDYLQKRLGELKNNIQGLASGDFSNQSLVTQAASLAPQISRDPHVQSAVMSTQQVRSLINSQRTTKSKDPNSYGPEAEWYDNRELNKYMSDKELGTLYGGPTQATILKQFDPDVQKLLDKIVPQKSVVLNSDGRYQWKKESYESVTNDRIQAVIDGYFAANPDAAEASKIKGLYTYRNYDAPTMANTIQTAYEGHIKALQDMNEQYKTQIDNNGKNADFVSDRKRAMEANMTSIAQMQQKINHYEKDKTGNPVFVPGEYINYLKDPSKLDEMKATLYNDNYKAMYSKLLQKDNVTDRTIVENYNATHADENYWKGANYNLAAAKLGNDVKGTQLEALKAGYKYDANGNLVALTEADGDMYKIYLQHLKGGGKKSDGTPTFDGHSYGNPFVGGTLNKGGEVDENQIDANIKSAQDLKNGEFKRFQESWMKANKKDPSAFASYMEEQGKLFDAGDPHVSTDYMAYKQAILKPSVDLQSNLQMKQDAQAYGVKEVPYNLSGILTVDVDPYVNNKGTKVNQVVIDRSNTQFNSELTSFRDLLKKYEPSPYTVGDDPNHMNDANPYKGLGEVGRREAILKDYFGNSPNYKLLLGLAKTKHDDYTNTVDALGYAFTKVVGGMDEIKANRKKKEKEYYATNARNFAPWESPYAESENDMMDVKNKAFSLLQSNGFKGATGKSFEGVAVGDLHVIGNSVDPVTDEAIYHVQGKDSKGNTIDDFVKDNSPGSSYKLPGYNQYGWVNRSLEVHNATPLTGDAVLHSTNGLVKFQIQKGPYGLTYSIIDGGNAVGGRRCGDAGDAFANIEKLSMTPSVNGGAMTAEEARYRFTHTEKDYKEKYQKH